MEQKLNIAEILKNKPRGTKLYSMIHGTCSFEAVTDEIFKINFCTSKFGLTQSGECTLIKFGNMYDGGECIIFPSKEMRDWKKFSWKKGDVLVGVGQRVIFEKFIDENYTKFQGKYSLSTYEDRTLVSDRSYYTSNFSKINDSGNVENYFEDLEEKLDGKLNRETLEVEKPQPEFKDGDIVVYGESVAICRRIYKHTLSFYVTLNKMFGLLFADEVESSEEYRFATDEDKQQLFDALEKEGKAWDAEKKQIVDIKKEHQFKPFEKVLVRDSIDDVWRASFFSHIKENDGRYVTTCVTWKFCIPYEGNEHLLGTTDNFE